MNERKREDSSSSCSPAIRPDLLWPKEPALELGAHSADQLPFAHLNACEVVAVAVGGADVAGSPSCARHDGHNAQCNEHTRTHTHTYTHTNMHAHTGLEGS